MGTLEQKGVTLPKSRQNAQTPQVAIITGALHTVFPSTRGKPRQGCGKDDARSMPRKRGVRRFSPAGGKNRIFVT
jgi:hypothetical protein